MPYVEGQTIHDADSHIMEMPESVHPYVDPKFRAAFIDKTRSKDGLLERFAKAAALHEDPEFMAGAAANIMLRKNHEALGAFRSSDRWGLLRSWCSPPRA
jgi:hypothetical protein